jgi:Mrp family chromosome partitioning ATPase
MNTLAQLIAEKPAATQPQGVTSIREMADGPVASRVYSVRDEQIQSLVQQLFFRQDPAPVRHVGFAAVGTQSETAELCLDVAVALSETGSHDIGLIDARLQSVPLHTQLQIPGDNHTETSWQIAPRLWLAPRRSWLDDSPQGIWDHSLGRLRTTTMEFDFSILCFDPVSWLTAKISQTCNGLVMVLTANKTRRLVAAQMQEQLRRARVPLLGTVLAERRFPIPEGLYRNL